MVSRRREVGGGSARSLLMTILGEFVLPAVLDALLEQPVFVANAVAVSRNAERGHRVHEAGGQSSEPAIAECGVGLDLAQNVEVDAERGERAPRGLGQPHVVERIEQQPPDQEFDREIIDALLPPFGVVAFRHPDVDQPVAQRHDGRLIPVMLARLLRRFGQRIDELGLDGVAQFLLAAGKRRGRRWLMCGLRHVGDRRCEAFQPKAFQWRQRSPVPFSFRQKNQPPESARVYARIRQKIHPAPAQN